MGARVHLIGICGTAMATVAAMLQRRGFDVSGSDEHVYPPMSDFLREEGIPIQEGFRAEHVDGPLEFVVVGNAVSRGNPEVEALLDRRLRYYSLPEVLREFFLRDRLPVVIAGTHGKTTTAAMAAWVLAETGHDPTMLTGGIPLNFGRSYRLGAGAAFVIEGDEYDSAFFDKTAKFLKYLPHIVVLNNIEYDHADIYPDLDAIILAFRRLVNLIPRSGALICADEGDTVREVAARALCGVETFGLTAGADWRAREVRAAAEGVSFDVLHHGRPVGRAAMPVLGEFNVRNALGAVAAAVRLSVPVEAAVRALATFRGVRRRLEARGQAAGVTVYDDFAHHPTAVRETLRAVRAAFPDRRIVALFEPRSATSCRRVFQEAFAEAFDAADDIVLAGVFRAATLPAEQQLSLDRLVADLRARGRPARAIADIDAIVSTLASELRGGDLVVAMSNGAFGGIHEKLLAKLRHSGRAAPAERQ